MSGEADLAPIGRNANAARDQGIAGGDVIEPRQSGGRVGVEDVAGRVAAVARATLRLGQGRREARQAGDVAVSTRCRSPEVRASGGGAGRPGATIQHRNRSALPSAASNGSERHRATGGQVCKRAGRRGRRSNRSLVNGGRRDGDTSDRTTRDGHSVGVLIRHRAETKRRPRRRRCSAVGFKDLAVSTRSKRRPPTRPTIENAADLRSKRIENGARANVGGS